jgi:hypothetical protein
MGRGPGSSSLGAQFVHYSPYSLFPSGQRFFYWRNFARRRIFFTSGLFLAKFGPKKNIIVAKNSSIFTFFIHLNPFSSTFRAFIQHPDELASGYVLVVPPGRKAKNHRKNTASGAHARARSFLLVENPTVQYCLIGYP